MVDQDPKKWMVQESYFGRSWSHIFYRWKCDRIMLGKTTRRFLLSRPNKLRRVIDVGCGSAGSLFEVFDLCSDIKGVQWYGLDLNIREVLFGAHRSRSRIEKGRNGVMNFLAGDLCHLPLPNESMDLLLCSEVLEHLSDPYHAITEFARVLKTGGCAFFTTPNPYNLIEQLGFMIDKITHGSLKRTYWRGCDEISAPSLSAEVGYEHISVHPYRVWRSWLEKAGLKVIHKVRGPMVFGGPFFDRHHFFTASMIAVDPLLDRLPFRFLLSVNLGIMCRKNVQ